MITRRTLIQSAIALPSTFGNWAEAQSTSPRFQPKWLEAIAKQLQKEFHLPAVWVAVNIEGVVESAVVGVRKVGDPTLATLEDKLTVASISKPMAGLWIASLVDKGKLSYEAKVLDILPELAADCLPEHEGITLGQLCTHRAAVKRDTSTSSNTLTLEQYPAERLRMAHEVLKDPSPAGSRGKEVYSNNGVTLAVTMAERAARESYEVAAGRFFRERLRLKSWGVWAMNLPDDVSLPWPHTMKDKAAIANPPKSVQAHFVRPSGSAHCTISDLVRFGLIAVKSSPLSESLLKPETWQTILEHGDVDRTALGCFYAGGREFPVFDHGGSLGTTGSFLRVLPAWRCSFAYHTNASADAVGGRGRELLQDAVRKRRAERNSPPACRITLTHVATMDSAWQREIVPTSGDDKVRIKINFRIEARPRTGDLLTVVKLGDIERRDDRFAGLAAGNHTLHFEFDTPKTKDTPASVTVDALGTAGNITPEAARYVSALHLA
ncbi:MAG: serine hydrolase [Armatimonadetes bacterium]|nr:serine hydrolase [Armatimonadota bacterium]